VGEHGNGDDSDKSKGKLAGKIWELSSESESMKHQHKE